MKAMLWDRSQAPYVKTLEQSISCTTYMFGAKNAEQNHPPRRGGLSQTNVQRWAACKRTALPTEWG